jgi:hypothetical protein
MKFEQRVRAHIVIYERRIPCQFPCTPSEPGGTESKPKGFTAQALVRREE